MAGAVGSAAAVLADVVSACGIEAVVTGLVDGVLVAGVAVGVDVRIDVDLAFATLGAGWAACRTGCLMTAA
jgi:hypothetical protein